MLFIHVAIGIAGRQAFTPSHTAVRTGQSANWRKPRGVGGRRHGLAEESYTMQNIKVEITEIVEDDSQGIPDTYTSSSEIPLELKGEA